MIYLARVAPDNRARLARLGARRATQFHHASPHNKPKWILRLMLARCDWPDSDGSEENVRPRRNAWANRRVRPRNFNFGVGDVGWCIHLLHVLFFLAGTS